MTIDCGDLVTSTRTRGPKPLAHLTASVTNGIVATRCGVHLYPGKHQIVTDERPMCSNCALFDGASDERKRFTRAAYQTTAGLRR